MKVFQFEFLKYMALQTLDALSLFGICFFSLYLRFLSPSFILFFPFSLQGDGPDIQTYIRGGGELIISFLLLGHFLGLYRKDNQRLHFHMARKIFETSILSSLVFISFRYFVHEPSISRAFLLLYMVLSGCGVLCGRVIFFALSKPLVQYFVIRDRVLLLGDQGSLEFPLGFYVKQQELFNEHYIDWVGYLMLDTTKKTDDAEQLLAPLCVAHKKNMSLSIPYLGDESILKNIIEKYHIHTIVVAYGHKTQKNYEELFSFLSNEAVEVKVVPDFGKYSTFTFTSLEEYGVPLLVFNKTPLTPLGRACKRGMDIIFSTLGLILLSPLFLLLAFLIRLTSMKGPVFYRQERMGLDGTCFYLYKFRTMRLDAEKDTGPVWATEEDQRVTRFGRILRKTSLDELPQLWNVFKGDMSLVGPRPERPVFVESFRQKIPKYMLRHKMKAGMTGWAQINGWRGNTSIEERLKHDLYYIGHWSLFFDMKILFLTLIRGFVNTNAY